MSVERIADRKPVVLVVDDEPLIRMNIAEAIDAAGMLALEASDATEALELLEARPEVDVLLSDVRMPGSMDGIELARIAASQRPELRVMIMSGYSGRPANRGLGDDIRFLSKPFPLPLLVEELNSFTAPRSGRHVA